MITRIVKMVFQEDKVGDFKVFIKPIVDKIANFDGCRKVEILQDVKQKNVFFSYSYWNNEQKLSDYRNSDFFDEVWAETKKMFADKPYAWSTEAIIKSN